MTDKNPAIKKSYLDFQAYCEVNEEFARCTLTALRATLAKLDAEGRSDISPIVWVHDYQLLVAAASIRKTAEEEGLRFRLGFFLHIPFPSWDIMRLFPWDDQVLQGMLGTK